MYLEHGSIPRCGLGPHYFLHQNPSPLLQSTEVRSQAHTYLTGTLRALDCASLEVGGVADHVHILCGLSRKISLSKSPPVIFWSLVTCNLAMMVLAIGVNLLPVFLTTLASDLGRGAPFSAEQLGRIGAVTFCGVVGGILVTGPLADRWGARVFAVGGNVLIAAGLLILRWTTDYPMLLGAAFVGGTGAGILDMILSPTVSSLTRGQSQTAALNVLHSFYCTGAIMTILVGSLALRFEVSWRTLSLALLPLPVAVGTAFYFLPMPSLVEVGCAMDRCLNLSRLLPGHDRRAVRYYVFA